MVSYNCVRVLPHIFRLFHSTSWAHPLRKRLIVNNNVAKGDLHILSYVHHMAQTARTDEAKQLFETFLNQEKKRLEVNDGARQNSSPSTTDCTLTTKCD